MIVWLSIGFALGVLATVLLAVVAARRRAYHSREGRRLGMNSVAATKEQLVSVIRRGGGSDAHTQVH